MYHFITQEIERQNINTYSLKKEMYMFFNILNDKNLNSSCHKTIYRSSYPWILYLKHSMKIEAIIKSLYQFLRSDGY